MSHLERIEEERSKLFGKKKSREMKQFLAESSYKIEELKEKILEAEKNVEMEKESKKRIAF